MSCAETNYSIQEDIINGLLTFKQIAVKHNVTLADVNLLAQELNDMIEDKREIDCRVDSTPAYYDYEGGSMCNGIGRSYF